VKKFLSAEEVLKHYLMSLTIEHDGGQSGERFSHPIKCFTNVFTLLSEPNIIQIKDPIARVKAGHGWRTQFTPGSKRWRISHCYTFQ